MFGFEKRKVRFLLTNPGLYFALFSSVQFKGALFGIGNIRLQCEIKGKQTNKQKIIHKQKNCDFILKDISIFLYTHAQISKK